MAIDLTIRLDASQPTEAAAAFQRNLSAAFAKVAADTKAAADRMRASMGDVNGAYRDSVASINAAIQANTAYAQSLRSIEDAAQRTRRVTSASILGGQPMSAAGAESVRSIQEAIRTGASYQQSLSSIEDANRRYTQAARASTRATTTFASAMSVMTGTLSALGITATIAGFVQMAKSLLDAGIALQSVRLQLEAVTGSAKAAGEAFRFIQEISHNLGLSLAETADQYAKLAASTRGTVLEGQNTRDVFLAVASAGRVMQLSQERLGFAFLALQQMAGKGVISMEELRRQLGEALPGALQATARELGVSTARLFGMVESGQLAVTQFFPALAAGLNKTFGQALPQSMNSAQASFGRLRTAWQELGDAFAQSGFLTLMTKSVEGLSAALTGLGAVITDVGQAMRGSTNDTRIVEDAIAHLNEQIRQTQRLINDLAQQGETNWLGKIFGGPDKIEALRQAALQIQGLTAAVNALKQSLGPPGAAQGLSPVEAQVEHMQRLLQRLGQQGETLDVLKIQGKLQVLGEAIAVLTTAGTGERQTLLETLFPKEADVEQRAATLLRQLQDVREKARIGFEQPFAEADVERQQTRLIAQAQQRLAVTEAGQARIQAGYAREAAAAQQALIADERTALAYAKTVSDRERVVVAFTIRRADLERQAALEEIRLARQRVAAEAEAQQALLATRIRTTQQVAAQQAPEAAQKTLASVAELNAQQVGLKAKLTADLEKLDAQAAETETTYLRAVTDVYRSETDKRLAILSTAPQEALKGVIAMLEEEKRQVAAAAKAEMVSRQSALQEAARQTETINASILAITEASLARETEQRVVAAGHDVELVKLIRVQAAQELAQLAQKNAIDVQTIYTEASRDFETTVKKVQNTLSTFIVNSINILLDHVSSFQEFMHSILLELRRAFIQFLADLAAIAIARPITVAITGVIGASGHSFAEQIAGSLGLTGDTSAAGGLINALGLRDLFGGISKLLSSAFSFLGDTIRGAAQGISQAVNSLVYPGIEGIGTSITSVAEALTLFGGLAGIGGGIYSAVTSPTGAGTAFGIGGALGGGAAAASALGFLPAAFGPIGLAAAAILPLIGSLFGEEAPSVEFGVQMAEAFVDETGQIITHGFEVTFQKRRGFSRGQSDQLLQAAGSVADQFLNASVAAINAFPDLVTARMPELQGELDVAMAQINDQLSNLQAGSEEEMQRILTQDIPRIITQSFLPLFTTIFDEAVSQLASVGAQVDTGAISASFAGVLQNLINQATTPEQFAAIPAVVTQVVGGLVALQQPLEDLQTTLGDVGASAIDLNTLLGPAFDALGQADTVEELNQAITLMNTRLQAATSFVTQLADVILQDQLGPIGYAVRQTQQSFEAMSRTAEELGVSLDLVTQAYEIQRDQALKPLTDAIRQAEVGPTAFAIEQLTDQFAQLLAAADDLGISVDLVTQAYQIQVDQALKPLQDAIDQSVETFTRATQSPMVQAQQAALALAQLSDEIAAAGDDATALIPLYEQMPQAISDAANAQVAYLQSLQQAFETAIAQVEQDIAQLEHALGGPAQDYIRAVNDLNMAYVDFIDAVNTGDTVAATQALTDYEQAIVAIADAEIAYLQEQHQAAIDAQQAQVDVLRDEVQVREEAVRATQSQLDAIRQLNERTMALVRGGQPPVQAIDTLRQQITTERQLAAQTTGEAQTHHLEALVNLNEELLRAGEQHNLLDVQQEALQNLQVLDEQLGYQASVLDQQLQVQQAQLDASQRQLDVAEQQLEALQDTTALNAQIAAIQQAALTELYAIDATLQSANQDWENAILQVELEALNQLALLNQQMAELRQIETAALNQQHGGLVGYAMGGRVRTVLEPGESVWEPPMSRALQGALLTLNREVPRFGGGGLVPGTGVGDSVPMTLPVRSIVLNRTATQRMFGGEAPRYQGGGTVQGAASDGPITVNIPITIYPTLATPMDMKRLTAEIAREVQRIVITTFGRKGALGGGR